MLLAITLSVRGGNVFDIRVGVAIAIGIKDESKQTFELHYAEVPDYSTKDEKVSAIERASVENLTWKSIEPNKEGDWLNQRSEEFETWPIIGEKKSNKISIFKNYSLGLATGRDAWVTGESKAKVFEKISILENSYREAYEAFEVYIRSESMDELSERTVNDFLSTRSNFTDLHRFAWNSNLKQHLARRRKLELDKSQIIKSLYRPFKTTWTYFQRDFNARIYQLPAMFPTPEHSNIGFIVMAPRDAAEFAVLATELIPDLSFFTYTGQFFPRFTWSPVDAEDGGLFGEGNVVKQGEASAYGQVGEIVDGYVRVDNLTDEIKQIYRDALGSDVSGDDIFHFVYGKLHDPGYRTQYAADLKKMLPHIETPSSRAEFDKFVAAGKELMALHVGYESVEPWPLDIQVKGDESNRDTWRVQKMKWAKRKDPETGKNVNDVTKLIYNKQVTISGIPAEADEYMLGSRSAVAWLIDRYQVKKDKASGIVNDPNDWADEVGNPRYIVDLIGKVTRVAMETVRIVDGLEN